VPLFTFFSPSGSTRRQVFLQPGLINTSV